MNKQATSLRRVHECTECLEQTENELVAIRLSDRHTQEGYERLYSLLAQKSTQHGHLRIYEEVQDFGTS